MCVLRGENVWEAGNPKDDTTQQRGGGEKGGSIKEGKGAQREGGWT